MILALLLSACTGPSIDDSSGAAASCGDADGDGTDTGNLPDVSGSWTSQLDAGSFEDGCVADDFDAQSEQWIGAFYVQGTAPDSLYVYFGPQGSETTDRFWGAMDKSGGLTFSGLQPHAAGMIHATFSGHLYADEGLGHTVVRGGAFLGLDTDDDDTIDCYSTANWHGTKSG